MKCIKLKNHQSFTIRPMILIWILKVVTCVPILKTHLESNPELKCEKHYPNGTVVGKYAYVDNEGNPVQVKYFADDSSYGVELKSVKVLESSTDVPLLQATKFDNVVEKEMEPLKVASDLMKIKYHVLGNEVNDPYEYLNKEIEKIKTVKGNKANNDYEIFYQKELRAPKKSNKNKVRVYFDKEKRWVRNVNNKHYTCDCNV